MMKLLYPYECAKSVFAVDYEKLYENGFRGLIFDIDNTLVHHGDDSTPEIDNLFNKLHEIGFKTLLLSNNGEERVQRFLKNIDSYYICNASKPKPGGYKKAAEMMNLKKEQTVFFGDQIFTDILGANLSGIPNVLVDFIRLEGETNFGKRRQAENIILKFYRKSKKSQHRLGKIIRENEYNAV